MPVIAERVNGTFVPAHLFSFRHSSSPGWLIPNRFFTLEKQHGKFNGSSGYYSPCCPYTKGHHEPVRSAEGYAAGDVLVLCSVWAHLQWKSTTSTVAPGFTARSAGWWAG